MQNKMKTIETEIRETNIECHRRLFIDIKDKSTAIANQYSLTFSANGLRNFPRNILPYTFLSVCGVNSVGIKSVYYLHDFLRLSTLFPISWTVDIYPTIKIQKSDGIFL